MNTKEIADKLDKEFKNYFVSVAYDEKEIGEDSIGLLIDNGLGQFHRDDINIKDIYNFVKKQLRGYSDVEVILDESLDSVIVYFNNVSEYSDRELIQTVQDLVYGANAKFDIKYNF